MMKPITFARGATVRVKLVSDPTAPDVAFKCDETQAIRVCTDEDRRLEIHRLDIDEASDTPIATFDVWVGVGVDES